MTRDQCAEEWEGGSQMVGCWDTENVSLNNWEMLSNKGVETADQCERGMATRQPITTLLIFLVWSTGLLLIFFGWPDGKLFLSFLPILLWKNGRMWVSILPGIHLLKCSPVTDRAEECGGDQVPRAPATSLLQCAEQSFYKSGALNISPHQHPRSRSRGFLLLIKIV